MLIDHTTDSDSCIVFENASIRVGINLDCGAHIYELVDVRSGSDILYRDPAGSRDYRVGAWYELFPNAGPACHFQGRQFSRHGDLQHQRWRLLRASLSGQTAELSFAGSSREIPVLVTRHLQIGPAGRIGVRESLSNESSLDLRYLWGHHITFGENMMEGGARVEVPDIDFTAELDAGPDAPYLSSARGRLNRFPGKDGVTVDLTRFDQLPYSAMLFADLGDDAHYTVSSPVLGLTVRAEWDLHAFGSLWMWTTTQGTTVDSDLVACALEPQATAVPGLADACAAGTAPTLAPHARRTAWLNLEVAHDARS